MSLNSILQKIQQKGRIKSALPTSDNQVKSTSGSGTSASVTRTSVGERPVDPVVARLKAARKAEKEQKEKERREKKGLQPKKEAKPRAKPTKSPLATPRNSTSAGRNGNGRQLNESRAAFPVQRSTEKKAKMSFSELMKKASLIDQSKLSIAIKPKTKSPEDVAPKRPSTKDGLAARRPLSSGPSTKYDQNGGLSRQDRFARPAGRGEPLRNGQQRPQQKPRGPNGHVDERPSKPEIRAPLPVRKPSEKLQVQLKQRPNARAGGSRGRSAHDEEDDEDDDLDSFIASDEEEQESYGGDYDRDEIWSIFNRGRKREYYNRYDDEDSDDMEATGAEILEEELLSKRRAVAEDMREMKEEQRLAALKQQRKQKGGRR